jgi:hypothetical protein
MHQFSTDRQIESSADFLSLRVHGEGLGGEFTKVCLAPISTSSILHSFWDQPITNIDTQETNITKRLRTIAIEHDDESFEKRNV